MLSEPADGAVTGVVPLGGAVAPRIVDAQLHCWTSLGRTHWSATHARSHLEPYPVEHALAAMDAVGVHAALVHVLGSNDDRDAEDAWSEYLSKRHAGRIATVSVIDPISLGVEDAVMLSRRRRALATRLFFRTDADEAAYDAGAYRAFFDAVYRHSMPVKLFAPGRHALIGRIAEAYPDVPLIVDHLGMPQPPRHTVDDPPFKRLSELIALADYPNLSVKLTGLPSFSHQTYPYHDLWPVIERLLQGFGASRLIWGSDMTRFWGMFSYSELFGYIAHSSQLSRDEKAAMLGGTLVRLLGWPGFGTSAAR